MTPDHEAAMAIAQEWVAQRSNVTDKGLVLARAYLELHAHQEGCVEREEAAKYMDSAEVVCSNLTTKRHYRLAALALREPVVTEATTKRKETTK